MRSALPYWRLSLFYGVYFASLGALLPFLPLYFQHLGYTPNAIGQLMAVLMATKVGAPYVWSWLADYSGTYLRWVRFGALASMICFAGILWDDSFVWLVLVLVMFSFFWNAILSPFEAVTFAHLGNQAARYTQIRLWGSVGFIVISIGLGWLFEHYAITWLVWVLLALFVSIWLSSLTVPEKNHLPHHDHPPIRQILFNISVITFLSMGFLIQASHSVYYTFYTIYLEQYGYSRWFIGWMWALGVAAEVMLFCFFHRLIHNFSLKTLFLVTMLLTGIRWLLIGYGVESLTVLVLAQLLHAVSFGSFHGAAMQYVRYYFPGRLHARGQALYSSSSFGLGGALGSLASGYVWGHWGAELSYLASTGLCLLALLLGWLWLDNVTPRETS